LIVTQQPQVAVYCSNLLAILKMVATDTIVCRVRHCPPKPLY